MTGVDFSQYRFNRVKRRGDPKQAYLETGHLVEKEERLYFRVPDEAQLGSLMAGEWMTLRCADYHGEHFIYIDPNYLVDDPDLKGHCWFAMCTCGSPAVIVNPDVGGLQESDVKDQMLVCYAYTYTLHAEGFGRHTTTGKTPWA
jgi:hypothetical protein